MFGDPVQFLIWSLYLIPAALIRWELTGRKSDELARLLD